MTDPQTGKILDNVTFSDTTDIDLASPAISIPSDTESRRGRKYANQAHLTSTTRDVGQTEPASATNPSLESIQQDFLPYEQDVNPNNRQTIATSNFLVGGSANVEQQSSQAVAFASFGSQPWTSTAGPYLDFERQPAYEPIGELATERFETFDQFDNPPNTRGSGSVSQEHSFESDINPVTSPLTLLPNEASSVNVFAQPLLPRSALKRKAHSPSNSPVDSPASKRNPGTATASQKTRTVSFDRMSGLASSSPDEGSTSSEIPPVRRPVHAAGLANNGRRTTRQSANIAGRTHTNVTSTVPQPSNRPNRGSRAPSGHPPSILPPEKVFPIQIGSELFRLSGASISSDAPSYFTQFFEEQIRQNEESGGVRTLYIDRDPVTFRDVARHLQGYYVKPTDGSHFVKLFADAQFYSLPRLIDQLFESEIFIQIGERHFQIPKDIFSEPGNSPNFFSLGFAVFFSTPGEVFPGLDRRGLLRPPSITPPYVPGRSAETFAELLHLLRGYPLNVRNEAHRAQLLRDCRYFHLRGLEQKIIAHEITYNLERQKQEICIRLEDVKPSGVLFQSDETEGDQEKTAGWVHYSRPFVDDAAYEMVVEIGGECTVLDLNDMRADFHNLTKARVSSLFQVVANKMNLPSNAPLGLMMLSGGRSSQPASPAHTPLSEDRVKVRFDSASDITLDGTSFEIDWDTPRGNLLAFGPRTAASGSESDSEAMSEDTSSRSVSKGPSTSTAMAGKPMQTRQSESRQTRPGAGQSTAQTSNTSTIFQTSGRAGPAPPAKKRKRQNSPTDHGEWTVRTGLWRLRVQPSPQDSIRGGFEIIFTAVKLDAFSNEKARNARRSFLN